MKYINALTSIFGGNMKYIIILISIFIAALLLYLGFHLSFFVVSLCSGKEVVRIPFTHHYIAKIKPSEWEGSEAVNHKYFFNKFIEEQNKKGWKYNPEKRLGRLIIFEKDGKVKGMSYPRFIGIKW
ncbi:hypothetical protein [Caloranaerobacter azorensis]|uniref:Uncharacterized protein n=1 Tax=Caloranaerobacter azorensis TaxID=116090 RepID=A0A6P1YCZ1_9FIRM|nr:hypothetical protein [Caloranaerobacter azorensis]QIB27199.1 hypothetical protein G3A45_07810 [Caloranaerobacter azorensis]